MKQEEIIFDGSCYDYLMRNNECSVGFNMPDALEGENSHGLPPYAKHMPYLVDEYPACPENWMRSEGNTKSYFVPVEEGKGMWLDFNNNDLHTHHMAILVSVQGVNPITGLPCQDAQLEQYIDECPKHKKKFGPDRYCEKCELNWPKQNYICTTGTPSGQLWLDGFKTAEGLVRQYILTSEKMRGVASNIIGEDRVYAIGLSFFLSKEKKPEVENTSFLRGGSKSFAETDGTFAKRYKKDKRASSVAVSHKGATPDLIMVDCDQDVVDAQLQLSQISNDPNQKIITNHAFTVQVQSLEVGAGANINQAVHNDPEGLDYWHDKPESIICVNYCSEAEATKIVEQGRKEITSHPEGFLQDVPVGN